MPPYSLFLTAFADFCPSAFSISSKSALLLGNPLVSLPSPSGLSLPVHLSNIPIFFTFLIFLLSLLPLISHLFQQHFFLIILYGPLNSALQPSIFQFFLHHCLVLWLLQLLSCSAALQAMA